MKKKVIVELDNNDVLIKFSIEKHCMDSFLGRATQLSDYVCGLPVPIEESKRKQLAIAMLEDSIYTALNERDVESVYEVLAAPMNVNSYINGEYDNYRNKYECKQVADIINEFFPIK